MQIIFSTESFLQFLHLRVGKYFRTMASIKLQNPLPMIVDFHKTLLQSAKENNMGDNFVSLCEDTISILTAMISEFEENRMAKIPLKQSHIKS